MTITDLNAAYTHARAGVAEGAAVVDALISFMRERAALEESYSRSLARLSRTAIAANERAVHSAFGEALALLKGDISNEGVQHAELSSCLQRDVIAPLEALRAKDPADRVTTEAKRVTKEVKTAYDRCKRAYNKYITLHRRAVEACAGAGLPVPALWEPPPARASSSSSSPALRPAVQSAGASAMSVGDVSPIVPSPLEQEAAAIAGRRSIDGVSDAPLPPAAVGADTTASAGGQTALPPPHRRARDRSAGGFAVDAAPTSTVVMQRSPPPAADVEEIHASIGSGKDAGSGHAADDTPIAGDDATSSADRSSRRFPRRPSTSVLSVGTASLAARTRGQSGSESAYVGVSSPPLSLSPDDNPDADGARDASSVASGAPSSIAAQSLQSPPDVVLEPLVGTLTELTVAQSPSGAHAHVRVGTVAAHESAAASARSADARLPTLGDAKSPASAAPSGHSGAREPSGVIPNPFVSADAESLPLETIADDSFNESIRTAISGVGRALSGVLDGDSGSDAGSVASSATDGTLAQALSGRWKAMTSSLLNFSFTGTPTAGAANLSTTERIESLRQTASMACAAADAARKECEEAWEAHGRATSAFSGQLMAAVTIFREIEKRRVSEMCDSLRRYTVFVSSTLANLQYDVNRLATAIEEAGTAALSDEAASPMLEAALVQLADGQAAASAAAIAGSAPPRRASGTSMAAAGSSSSLRRLALEAAASRAGPATPIGRQMSGDLPRAHGSSVSLDAKSSGATLPGGSFEEVVEHGRQMRAASNASLPPQPPSSSSSGQGSSGGGIARFWKFGRSAKAPPSASQDASSTASSSYLSSPLATRHAPSGSSATVIEHVAESPVSVPPPPPHGGSTGLRSLFTFGSPSGKTPQSAGPDHTDASSVGTSATSSPQADTISSPPNAHTTNSPSSGLLGRLRLATTNAPQSAGKPAPLPAGDMEMFVRAAFDPVAALPTSSEQPAAAGMNTTEDDIPSLTLEDFAAGAPPPPRGSRRLTLDAIDHAAQAASSLDQGPVHPQLPQLAGHVADALLHTDDGLARFVAALEQQRGEGVVMTPASFDMLTQVLNTALDVAMRRSDFKSARLLMVITQTFYTYTDAGDVPPSSAAAPSDSSASMPAAAVTPVKPTPPSGAAQTSPPAPPARAQILSGGKAGAIRHYLQAAVKGHPLWQLTTFWEAAVLDSLTLAPGTTKTRGEGRNHDVAFGQLGFFAYNMASFNFPPESIRKVFSKHAKTLRLSESEIAQLNASIDLFASEHARSRSNSVPA